MEKCDIEKNILIADDSDVIRKLLINYLQRWLPKGEIFESSTGVETLEILKNNKIDWLFIDWFMPETTGMEVIEKLKEDEDYWDLPIVMISAESNRDEIKHALQTGRIIDYIHKPVQIEKLKSVIDKLIKRNLP